MSPEPATPDTALQVPATPTGAVRSDAVAQAPRVLQEQAIGDASFGDTVIIADSGTRAYAGYYLEQVYGVSSSRVRYIASMNEAVATILASVPCERVVLLLHSGGDQLTVGPDVESLDSLAMALRGAWGKVGRMMFDGCTLGTQPSALFRFAESLGLTEASAWTHTHVLAHVYKSMTVVKNAKLGPEILAYFEGLAPWLPRGEFGATDVASTLGRELLTTGRLDRAFEAFYAGFDAVDFEAVVGKLQIDPSRYFPRRAVENTILTTLEDAARLDDPVSLPLVPARRVIRLAAAAP